MSDKLAARRGLEPLGIFRGFAVAGCEPDEMGIGPVFAVPKLLERTGVKIGDIGLWELNEAFAVQVIYCRDKLGIPDDRLNVERRRDRRRASLRRVGHAPDRPRAASKASAAARSTSSSRCASAAARALPGCSRSRRNSCEHSVPQRQP